jgi:hypothetical protein
VERNCCGDRSWSFENERFGDRSTSRERGVSRVVAGDSGDWSFWIRETCDARRGWAAALVSMAAGTLDAWGMVELDWGVAGKDWRLLLTAMRDWKELALLVEEGKLSG